MAVRKKLNDSGRAVVFITTSVSQWLPIFDNEPAAQIALKTLKDNLSHFKSILLGYVLMPSHIHLIICIEDVRLLKQFVQTFRILTSKRIKAIKLEEFRESLYKNNSLRLWQPRYDDQRLITEKQFQIKLKYIHSNPVRSGLVKRDIDWPYSSASTWFEEKPGLINIETSLEWKI